MATPSLPLLPQGRGRVPGPSRKHLHLLCVLIGVGMVWLIGHVLGVPLTRQVAQVSDAAHMTPPGWLTGLPTEYRPPDPPAPPPPPVDQAARQRLEALLRQLAALQKALQDQNDVFRKALAQRPEASAPAKRNGEALAQGKVEEAAWKSPLRLVHHDPLEEATGQLRPSTYALSGHAHPRCPRDVAQLGRGGPDGCPCAGARLRLADRHARVNPARGAPGG
jgi:hypothetical protein